MTHKWPRSGVGVVKQWGKSSITLDIIKKKTSHVSSIFPYGTLHFLSRGLAWEANARCYQWFTELSFIARGGKHTVPFSKNPKIIFQSRLKGTEQKHNNKTNEQNISWPSFTQVEVQRWRHSSGLPLVNRLPLVTLATHPLTQFTCKEDTEQQLLLQFMLVWLCQWYPVSGAWLAPGDLGILTFD